MTRLRELVLGTAGHIDHGKTALVRMLTGVHTDRLPEELRRGMSIDLGFASMELDGFRLDLVDVPGHERFIRNMLAGASGFDLALLIVAADDSVMPQTREHLDVLSLLGLSGGLIVVTKCDLADPGWVDLVEDEARSLTRGTFLQGAQVVRTSAASGAGLAELKAAIQRLCDSVPARPDAGPFRLCIDRSFSRPGHGTVVTGTVVSGQVSVEDELEWLPAKRTVRVRGVQRHGVEVERVGRGARAALNLAGVDHDQVARGHELASFGYLETSQTFSVALRPSRRAGARLRHRARYRCHIGTAEVGATLILLNADESAGEEPVTGQLWLNAPVAGIGGQPFILRQESPQVTVGGGTVLQPLARRLRRRDRAAAAAGLRRLLDPRPAARIEQALRFMGASEWTVRELARDSNVAEAEMADHLAELSGSGRLVGLDVEPGRERWMTVDSAADLEARVLRTVERLHSASPRHRTIVRPKVAAAFEGSVDEPLVSAIIDRLASQARIVATSRSVALPGHEPRLSRSEVDIKRRIVDVVGRSGPIFLRPADWPDLAGPNAAAVPDLIGLLIEEARIVELAPSLYVHFDAAAEIRRRVTERLQGGARITMSELRDLLGTTRKFAVPVGEYLDRTGVTVRDGDARRLGPGAAETDSEACATP